MAIKPCKECGQSVSDKAASCPNCGAKVKKIGVFLKVIIWFFGIIIGLSVLSAIFNDNNTKKKVSDVQSGSSDNKATSMIEDHWFYHSTKDELRGKTTEIATNKSLNTVNFDFPYNGGSNLVLKVRKNHTGTDVFFIITKGQFVCGLVDGCNVAFKFDDGEVLTVSAIGDDSHSSDILFVKNTAMALKIVDKLKTSKKLIIAPKFYQYGEVQFNFDVSNYKSI